MTRHPSARPGARPAARPPVALLLASLAALVVATLVLGAGAARAGDLVARDAWIRLPPPLANAAGYLVLANVGERALRVTGVACDAAERTELHQSWVERGIARMRPVDGIDVPPGGEVVLEPRGLHVMLVRPKELEEGQRVPLRFAYRAADAPEGKAADELVVEAVVRRPGPASGGEGAD